MRCPSFSSIAIAAALTLATACDDPVAVAPELPSVDRGAGPSASEDPVGAALHQQVVGHALDYEEVGAQVSGELGPAEAHSQPLILIGTWCYRVFAQGGAGLEDLAIEVVDPNGVPLQRDSEVGPSASLGLTDPICPYSAGRYTLEVRAVRGSGPYAYRVFRKQSL